MAQKVLVVDDSKSIVTMIQYSLEKDSYEVLLAGNGEEGLKMLEETGGVNLIICDLNMPVMDGMTMLKEVKSSSRHSSVPFIILTTEAKGEVREEARQAGARAFIIKPFTEEQLLGAVRKFIK
ncbi:MAG: response regulator [Thermodesulfovibrionales bacterium]|nr:response regulator [Thermodesulfovibrionales bacterium]